MHLWSPLRAQEIFENPEELKKVAFFMPPDSFANALRPGAVSIPQPNGTDNVIAPDAEEKTFTIITPYRIYLGKHVANGKKMTLSMMLQMLQLIKCEYNRDEKKHWLPLFTS